MDYASAKLAALSLVVATWEDGSQVVIREGHWAKWFRLAQKFYDDKAYTSAPKPAKMQTK